MKTNPWLQRAASCALMLSAGTWALAQGQADGALLKGKDVTEAGLLRELTPLDEGTQGRALVLGSQKNPALAAPRKRASASLLITFETNSAVLSSGAREQLDVVAAALRNDQLKSYSFQVEGHADPRGRSGDNLVLSQERAESVRRYLVDMHGIQAERLMAVGKGDLEPLIRSVPAAPENRRVTIVTQIKSP